MSLFDPTEVQPDVGEVTGPLTDAEHGALEQSQVYAQLRDGNLGPPGRQRSSDALSENA